VWDSSLWVQHISVLHQHCILCCYARKVYVIWLGVALWDVCASRGQSRTFLCLCKTKLTHAVVVYFYKKQCTLHNDRLLNTRYNGSNVVALIMPAQGSLHILFDLVHPECYSYLIRVECIHAKLKICYTETFNKAKLFFLLLKIKSSIRLCSMLM
jgi:hypothetical protein